MMTGNGDPLLFIISSVNFSYPDVAVAVPSLVVHASSVIFPLIAFEFSS